MYLRKFERTYGVNAPGWGISNPDGSFTVGAFEHVTNTVEYLNRRTYIHGYRGRRRRKSLNPVDHWRATSNLYPFIGCVPWWGGNYTLNEAQASSSGAPWSCKARYFAPFNIERPPLGLPMPTYQLDADHLFNEAVREMVPEWNAVVSAVEAIELPDLFSGVARQGIAGETLRYNLALLPLVGEVQSIWQRIWGWQDLIVETNRRLARGFRAASGHTFENLVHQTEIDTPVGPVLITFEYKVTITHGVRVVGNIDPQTALFERFGVNSSLQSILWEAMPLSFVVDYFLPIGTILSRVVVPNVVPTKWWSSSKTEGTFKCELLWHGNLVKIQDGSFMNYHRTPQRWDTFDGIQVEPQIFGLPSSTSQWANLAALTRSFTATPVNRQLSRAQNRVFGIPRPVMRTLRGAVQR